MDHKIIAPLVYAYIGDAEYTLFVRTALIESGEYKLKKLHDACREIVSARIQAIALRSLSEQLTDEESAMFMRGRNTSSSVPKSCTVAEYRAASGFETLLGYLCLSEQRARAREIMQSAYDCSWENIGK